MFRPRGAAHLERGAKLPQSRVAVALHDVFGVDGRLNRLAQLAPALGESQNLGPGVEADVGLRARYAYMHRYLVGVLKRLFVEVRRHDVEEVHRAGQNGGDARLLVGNLLHVEPVEVCELGACAVARLLAARHIFFVPVQDDLVARVPAYELVGAGGDEVLDQLAGRVLLGGLFGHDVGLCAADVAECGHQQGRRLAELYLERLVVNFLEAHPDVVENGAEGLILMAEAFDGRANVFGQDLRAVVPRQVVAQGEGVGTAVNLPVVRHVGVDEALRVPLREGFPEVPGYAPADGGAGGHRV